MSRANVLTLGSPVVGCIDAGRGALTTAFFENDGDIKTKYGPTDFISEGIQIDKLPAKWLTYFPIVLHIPCFF